MHFQIASLQHKIKLNHLDTICNWLEMSKVSSNIINNLKGFSPKKCGLSHVFSCRVYLSHNAFIALLGSIGMSHVRRQQWVLSLRLDSISRWQTRLCRRSPKAELRCMAHCCRSCASYEQARITKALSMKAPYSSIHFAVYDFVSNQYCKLLKGRGGGGMPNEMHWKESCSPGLSIKSHTFSHSTCLRACCGYETLTLSDCIFHE